MKTLLLCLLTFVVLGGAPSCTKELAVTADATVANADASDAGPGQRLAIVYRDVGACDGCAESLATLIEAAGFQTRFVTANDLLSDETFQGVALYAQPGGDDTTQVYGAVGAAHWDEVVTRIRTYVSGGGHYLGVCLGGFLAAQWIDDAATIPALRLIPGDADYFEMTPVNFEQDQVVPVTWFHPAVTRSVYFQAGPEFTSAEGGDVYGEYSDHSIAAMIAPYGTGKVAVSGIHFEADASWYTDVNITDPDGIDADLGLRMIADLIAP